MPRKRFIIPIAITLLAAQACTKQTPSTEPAKAAAPTERISSLAGTSHTILQKTFTLDSSTTFPFEIPAHALQPHLHGIFESYVGGAHGSSDNRANLEFMILDQEQQDAAEANRASDALFSV